VAARQRIAFFQLLPFPFQHGFFPARQAIFVAPRSPAYFSEGKSKTMKVISLKWEFIMIWAVFLLTLLVLESCVHEPLVTPVTDPDPAPDPVENCDENVVYFQNEVLPLLISNCAKSGCHDAATAEEGIVLDSYANLVRSRLVKAGNPGGSELYEKITTNESDEIMPPPPADPLNAGQIATIRDWIAQGAQNNVCTSAGCDTTNVTYSLSILPLITNKCTGCHSGNAPSGNLNFTNFQTVQTVALNGRLIGSVTHASGFSPMPPGGAKLSDCEINMINIWIDGNAANN
jgi:hypothetical protein